MTALAPGTQLGPYEIQSSLGAGGMGVVYRARDTRLGRRVAIKLLPSDLTQDARAQRLFHKEARAASALDHPNICTIHDISQTDDGATYLVMALYEGVTLSELIAHGDIAPEQAIDLTIQLLSGLTRAHAAGIVHRDIKPANLMRTADGTLKILDFGVAMLSDGPLGTDVTEDGVVGTVAYMSPEQATGLLPDLRSDLWSAGVVLYEMLTGQQPFRGDNALAVAHAIRTADAAPVTRGPSQLAVVLRRALEKDRDRRYASADAFLADLRAIRTAAHNGATGSGASGSTASAVTSAERRTNLPRRLPSLIGRDSVLARIASALRDNALITLAGFGGVGKTRLAQQVGVDAMSGFRDGVWFVDLAGLAAESEVLPTIARALGIREHASEQLGVTLGAALRDREMLLILDNCERMTETIAAFIEEVTPTAPDLKFLATTRAPLGVYGEQVVRVDGLDAAAAVALFEERAGQGQVTTVDDRATAAELCRRLDYLPLAIELAAARVRSLSLKEILAKVNQRVSVLKATDRRAARHQTLEATVSWSYDLLAPEEQSLLNRLSVFVGSFDLAAAERVCIGDGIETYEVVDLLDRLVDKSLVTATAGRAATRYHMMDTVREFATQRLEASGQHTAMIDAHVRHFATQAQSLGDRIRGGDAGAASAVLLSDIENLNAAMDRLGQMGRHTEKAQLVTMLDLFWQIGAPGAGRLRYDELVAEIDAIDVDVRLSTLVEAASFVCNTGYADRAMTLLARASDVAAQHTLELPPYFYYVGATVAEMDGRTEDVLALCAAGEARLEEGDEFVGLSLRCRALTSIARRSTTDALAHVRQTLTMSQELGIDLFTAVAHMLIGTVCMLEGSMAEAEPELELSVELAGTAMPQVTIAALVAAAAGKRQDAAEESVQLAREAIRIEAETEIMPWFRALAARVVAWHWARASRAEDAVLVLAATDAMEQRLGFSGIWWAQPIRDEAWTAVRDTLTAPRIQELITRGRLMAMTELRQLLGA
jgi:predicted ATPase